jgi:serine/threonine protein kinase
MQTAEFWQLVAASRLLTPDQCRQLAEKFSHVRGAATQANARSLVEWLIAENVLSRYQSTVLLGGRAGPFFYGEYKVYDRRQDGFFKTSFRAVHVPTRHPVRLVFATGPELRGPQDWARVIHWCQAHCRVTHPLLVRCHELVDVVTHKFLVEEDVTGPSLRDRLANGQHLAEAEACRVVRDAALGLAQLHQAGLVHGDISPSSLVAEPGGWVKLLRNPLHPPSPVNIADPAAAIQLFERADYLAPELAQPGRPPDVQTDIYALGCTFYELLAGEPPFPGGDTRDKLTRHATQPIQPLEASRGVSEGVVRIVKYMMAKNAAIRYRDASEVADQLQPHAAPGPTGPASLRSPSTEGAYERSLAERLSTPPLRIATAPAPQSAAARPTMPAVMPTNRPAPAAPASAPPAAPLLVDDRQRRRRSKLSTTQIGLVAGAVLALVFIIVLVASNLPPRSAAGPGEQPAPEPPKGGPVTSQPSGRPVATPRPSDRTSPPPASSGGSATSPHIPNAVPPVELVPDDGRTLWAAPTSGPPIELTYVPQEAQLFLIARPASLIAADGQPVLDALGPEFLAALDAWQRATRLTLAEVDQLILALLPQDDGYPRAAIVVRTVEPKNLVALWDNPPPIQKDGEVYYTVQGWSFYVPPAGGGRVFVMGVKSDIEDVLQRKGGLPPLRRELEKLLQTSDADRQLSILFLPNFFFSDGRELLRGNREKLRAPFSWFLGDQIQAGLLGLHLGRDFYGELRLVGTLDLEPIRLAEQLQERLEQIPRGIERYLGTVGLNPYWQPLALKFPGMVRILHQQTRIGFDRDQAILNFSLPAAAAHNLVLASELALASTPGQLVTTGTDPPATPLTIDDALAHRMDLAFPAQPLEFAIRDLAQEVRDALPSLPFEFRIKIIGADLELDGITRNQQIRDFKEQAKPVSELLTNLVMRANPITTVKDPSEPDQKLIWVVAPDPEVPAETIVLVTTRQGAEKKGYTLPPPFVAK